MSQSGLLFDLDGTILDTSPDFVACLNQLLEQVGKPLVPDHKIRQTVSLGVKGLIKLGFGLEPQDTAYQDLNERFLDLYEKTLGKQTVFFPGMTDLLTLLKANKTPWGIVTNKPKRFSEPLLKKFGLWYETPCIVSGDTLSVCKPHPDPIHHACKLLQINPYTSLYVGDALNDVQASHAAGMRSCVAQYGYIHEEEDSKAWQATYYVTSPSQIYSIYISLKT